MLKDLDKKQRTELIITGISVIFLIFLVIGNTQKAQKKKASMITTGKTVASSLLAPISFEEKEIEESVIKEGWGRDPFLFGASTMTSFGLEGLLLNGIVWDKENPYAIINNDVVKIGDKIGDITVVEINEESVVMEEDGEQHTLDLNVAY